jgi:hypothetical protein
LVFRELASVALALNDGGEKREDRTPVFRRLFSRCSVSIQATAGLPCTFKESAFSGNSITGNAAIAVEGGKESCGSSAFSRPAENRRLAQ